jgi:NADH:ubiquinone oxidoreductase subunit 4 (subunit M)
MTAREIVSLTPLLVAVLALGVYPLWLIQIQEPALHELLGHLIGK